MDNNKMRGKQSIELDRGVYIMSSASVAGKKEGEGPLGDKFDIVCDDPMLGQDSWELAESTKKSVEGIYAAAEMANKQLAADSAAANNALLKNVQETSDTIARSTQAQVNGSLRSTGNMNSALTQSAQDLMNAAQHFNRQTTDSPNATLEAYDKSLARIIGQLNATASRLENSTNKVPRVVENAYEGMQKAFDLMARETAAMVRSMDQVRKELRQMTGV